MKNKGLISIIAVVLGLIAGGLLMLITGHNPIEGFIYLFQGGTLTLERIGNTIAVATPLVLTGLSVAFGFRTGLFNIGTPGQMLFGGFCATYVGLTFNFSRPVMILLIIIAGFIGGAVWAFVPGILRAVFNVHEVVSCIMMNWIAYWLVYYIIKDYYPNGNIATESRAVAEASSLRAGWLSDLFNGSYINLGIIVAIIAVIVISIILNKTTFGYELKAVGFNKDAAQYAGISVNKSIILSLMIAGGLAGLAGVTQYVGNAVNIQIGVMPSQGFDGIAVSLLGINTPIGALISALFFGLLYSGRGFMSVMTNVPPEIADTIIATIIYFAATSIMVERCINKIKNRKNKKHQNAADAALVTNLKNSDSVDHTVGLMPNQDEETKGDE